MYFRDGDGYQNFLIFCLMFSLVTVDNNKEVINWISTEISSKKIKPFGTNDDSTTSSLANGRVILKFYSSVLVEKNSSS